MSSSWKIGGLLMAWLAGIPGASLAQTADRPLVTANGASKAQPAGTGLAEIIVTAQRRSERLQDVPIAVSSLSSTALRNQNVHSLMDMTARLPSLVTTTSAGYGGAPLSIRGIGGANGGGEFLSDEPVAIYIDGVYVARLSVPTSDLVDVESVDVLRGPQGSLYGRNATAGAVVLTTKHPTDVFEGQVQADGDSLKDVRLQGVASGPVAGDKVLGRLAAAYTSLGGFGVNVLSGKPVNDGRDFTLRGSLRLLPTDRLTVDLTGETFDQHFQPGLFRVANLTGGPADSPYVLRPDFQSALRDSQFEASEEVNNHITTNAVTVVADLREDAFTLNSTAGYRTFDVDGLADSDNASPANLTGFPALRSYNDARLRNSQLSEEIRVSSPSAGSQFTWMAGLYYIHEQNAVDPFEIYNNAAYFKLGTDATFRAFQTSDAGAAYADVGYELVKGLTLRLGGRYNYDEKAFTDTQQVLTLVGGFSPALAKVVPAGYAVTAPPTYDANADFHNFSGRAVLDYKFSRNLMVYVSFSQGFKSGGFNAFALAPAFRPETINAYETGVKSEMWDHRLRINADVFQYNYDNLQVRLPVPTGGVDIENAASALVRGAELETTAIPVEGLQLGLNATYLDAHFTSGQLPEVPPNALFAFGANIPLQTVNIAGNTLSRAPKWQVGLTADYAIPVAGDKKVTVGMSYRFQSKEYFLETDQSAPTFQSAAWSELGAHVTLAKVHDRWGVTAYAENILDERTLTQISPLSAYPEGTMNPPRRVGVRMVMNF